MLESALLCLGSFAAGCCSRGWVPRFKRRVRFWNRSLSAARKGRALHGRGEASPTSPASPRSPSKATSVAESRASADSEARMHSIDVRWSNPQSMLHFLDRWKWVKFMQCIKILQASSLTFCILGEVAFRPLSLVLLQADEKDPRPLHWLGHPTCAFNFPIQVAFVSWQEQAWAMFCFNWHQC